MQPAAMVVLLDERRNIHAHVIPIPIGVGGDLFSRQRLYEALATGVVIRVGWPAHARDHVMRPQPHHVRSGRILDPAIGMMDLPL